MADKTNYLVSHFFVPSDCFLQFGSLRDFAFRGGCCSTVLAKVNGKTNADLCLYKQVTSPPKWDRTNTRQSEFVFFFNMVRVNRISVPLPARTVRT